MKAQKSSAGIGILRRPFQGILVLEVGVMACCSNPGSCGGDTSIPWFSALRDPSVRRLFLARYRRELFLGLGAGCLALVPALLFGEGVGGLGLPGPWLHLHAAAAAPAFLLGGTVLALSLAGGAAEGWLKASARTLGCVLLGGLANGLLDSGEGFLQGGGPVSLLAYGVLGLPALWLAWGALTLVFRPGAGRASC